MAEDIDRLALLPIVKEAGLTGWGIEVGVDFGDFSCRILEGTDLSCLFSVDPWFSHRHRMLAAHEKLIKFGDRNVLMRCTSEMAAKCFADNSLDFIHIDGVHTVPHIDVDIDIWWPKVRVGGIFSGHDYEPGYQWPNFWQEYGVINAVNRLVERENQTLHVIGSRWHSWYIKKKRAMITLL